MVYVERRQLEGKHTCVVHCVFNVMPSKHGRICLNCGSVLTGPVVPSASDMILGSQVPRSLVPEAGPNGA
jgi:hypothetical protein